MTARTRRRGRDASGHVDPFFRRRERFKSTLESLGLWHYFADMPRWTQELFWRRKIRDPVAVFARSVPDDVDGRLLRKEVEANLRDATVQVDFDEMVVRDFYGVLLGCLMTVRAADAAGSPESVLRFLREARPVLERCYEDYQSAAALALYQAANNPIIARGRLDGRLLTARLESVLGDGNKTEIKLVVEAHAPDVRRVMLDGVQRRMYRVGDSDPNVGLRWVEWHDDDATDGAASQTLRLAGRPIYVQAHALRQLRERLCLPKAAPYLEAWLAHSLASPVVVERQPGGDLLVEFRFCEQRVGYLVVTPMADLVAVRTFLFLTMEPSPESRLLRQQLRLARRDAAWLGLDTIAAFTRTDLKDDATLRSLLGGCNCGHLFDLDDFDFTPRPTALAAEVKRYLRLAA